jgi:hypothetical protein
LSTSSSSCESCESIECQREASWLAAASIWLRATCEVGLADTSLAAAKNADHGPDSDVAESDNRLSRRSDCVDNCCRRPSSPLLSICRAKTRPSARRRRLAISTPAPA